ncbi:hypothetical protein [Nocardia tengchongensis]|uniref:hypothetical protein n=1 Tax=Nocardia tengchongensis TaxID=2055889 RepID=UPI0036A48F65
MRARRTWSLLRTRGARTLLRACGTRPVPAVCGVCRRRVALAARPGTTLVAGSRTALVTRSEDRRHLIVGG